MKKHQRERQKRQEAHSRQPANQIRSLFFLLRPLAVTEKMAGGRDWELAEKHRNHRDKNSIPRRMRAYSARAVSLRKVLVFTLSETSTLAHAATAIMASSDR